jgi:UDP-glucose:(heptosyl)LPS alpha-1,3-glucosyltransferase
MHLAIIRQRFNPFGGAERFIDRAVSALRSQGARVTLITRSWQSGSAKDVVLCNPFYLGKIWRDWGFARNARKVVRSANYDLVQSHERIWGCDIYRAGDGVHAEWLAQRGRAQSRLQRILTRLNPYHSFVLAAEKRTFASPRLRAVICNSEMVRDEILEHFRLPRNMLHVVYNGIDTDLYHPRVREEWGELTRHQLGIPSGSMVALFVGSGFLRKGLDVAIEALSKTHSNIYLVIAGTDKHAVRYTDLARTLGVAHRLRMIGGQQNMLQYYGCADFLVLPTIYDPFPNAVLEALACALPVITSNKCGAATLIEREQCGNIHDARDAHGIAQSMDVLGTGSDIKRLSANARRAAESFTLDAMASKLLDLYALLNSSSTDKSFINIAT